MMSLNAKVYYNENFIKPFSKERKYNLLKITKMIQNIAVLFISFIINYFLKLLSYI